MRRLLILAALLLTGCTTPQGADEPVGGDYEFFRYTHHGRTPVWGSGSGMGLRR